MTAPCGKHAHVKVPASFNLEPILPGLNQAEFQARLVETIETATTALVLEAYGEGLARPLKADLRARLDELARTTTTAADPTY